MSASADAQRAVVELLNSYDGDMFIVSREFLQSINDAFARSIPDEYAERFPPNQTAIFAELERNQGYPVSIARLMEVSGTKSKDSLQVQIYRLRKQIERTGEAWIDTVRKGGYMLRKEPTK